MVIWAGNFVVVKGALAELPPIGFTTIRFVLAAIVLLISCRIIEGSIWVPRRDAVALAGLGALGFGIYQPLWTVGLTQTTAGDSSLLVAATPILTLLIAAAIGSDHLTRSRLIGTLVSFAGVALVVASGGSAMGSHLVGNVITLTAAGLWAAYVALGAPVLRRHSPLRTTAWAVTFGTLVMLPLGGWQLSTVDWGGVTMASVYAVLYAGLASIVLGNVLQFRAVQQIGPARASAFQFLVPPLALVLAVFLLDEPIRVEQVVGGIVIVVGILIARRSARRGPTPAGQPLAAAHA